MTKKYLCTPLLLLFLWCLPIGVLAQDNQSADSVRPTFKPRPFITAMFGLPVDFSSSFFMPAVQVGCQFSPKFMLMAEVNYNLRFKTYSNLAEYIPSSSDRFSFGEFRAAIFPAYRLRMANKSSLFFMLGLGYESLKTNSSFPEQWTKRGNTNTTLRVMANPNLSLKSENFILHPRVAYEFLSRSARRKKRPMQKMGIAFSAMLTPHINRLTIPNVDVQVYFASSSIPSQRQIMDIPTVLDITTFSIEFYIGTYFR